MTSDPARPLLSVKQSIPTVQPAMVPRVRLLELLDKPSRLGLVVAPAGWGKTSLLSRWATSAVDTRVAWVSLDETDDEPVRFWTYVLTALHTSSDQVTASALDLVRGSPESLLSHALPLLLNELAEASARHLLVLDDLHTISDPLVHEALEFLVAYLPPTLRLVIGTRVDPPLPLARLRARGELTEVRAADLRFSPSESAAFVSTVVDGEMDQRTIELMWERTEGWAAGLQLAALALRSADPGAEPGDVLRDDRHLLDYFTDEVLPTLAPRHRDLLVRAAPLELLSGSLCDAALGVDGSSVVLAEMVRADLFVTALDRDHQWYRCHRLLRDAVLRGGRAAEEDVDQVLHRAAEWFADHDRLDDAVRHLLAANDHAGAARVMAANLLWFLRRGWSSTYLGLGEQLPTEVVDAQLAASLAYAADRTGHVDRVVAWLDVAEARIDETSTLNFWRSVPAGVMALRAVIGTPLSEPDRMVTLCEKALELERDAGSDHHPDALAALGGAYVLAGRFDDAAVVLTPLWRDRATFYWAAERSLQVAGYLALSLVALDRDDELDALLASAGPLGVHAEKDWGSGAAARVVSLLRLVEGRRSYLRGDLDGAARQLDSGVTLAELAGRRSDATLGLTFLADLRLAQGDRGAARAALTQAVEYTHDEAVSPFVLAWLEEAQARIGRVAVKEAARTGSLYEELTDRELSILRMLPGTATQREIGAALFLSVNTVKAYNKSLYRKLAVGSRQDAVREARRLGLI